MKIGMNATHKGAGQMTKQEQIADYRKKAAQYRREAAYMRSIGDTGDAAELEMLADEALYQANKLEGKQG